VTARTQIGGRDLIAATVVGVLLIVAAGSALWWRTEALVAVVLLLLIAAFVDLVRALDGPKRPVLSVLVSATIVMLPATVWFGATGQLAGVLTLFAGAVLWLLARAVTLQRLMRAAGTVFAGVWVLLPASFAFTILSAANGRAQLGLVIGVVALMDIGGYAVGVPFGRHKLSVRLSPNKTVEGLLGGLVISVVAATVAWPIIFTAGHAWQGAVFGVLISIAAACGDIAESGVKRALDVKDFGTFLPGHGGVLDRIDGLLFALPVATVLFAVL